MKSDGFSHILVLVITGAACLIMDHQTAKNSVVVCLTQA